MEAGNRAEWLGGARFARFARGVDGAVGAGDGGEVGSGRSGTVLEPPIPLKDMKDDLAKAGVTVDVKGANGSPMSPGVEGALVESGSRVGSNVGSSMLQSSTLK